MHPSHALLTGLIQLCLLATPAPAVQEPVDESPLVLADLDFESAVSRAERLQKFLIILWVDGPETPAVRGYREAIFGDSGVKDWIEENGVAVRINTKEDREGARRNPMKRYPTVDIIDFVRGGRVGQLTPEDGATEFLATVYGATAESSQSKKPEGKAAEEPFRWLAWANTRFRALEPQGRKDAVNGYTWCLRRADDFRPGFRSRYLEFLLERISAAKMEAPEAVAILETESRILSQQLLQGLGDRQTAYDLVRVNKWRRKDLETRDLFIELAGLGSRQEEARRWLFGSVVPVLGRYQQYSEILNGGGLEATAIFASRIASLNAASGAPQVEGEAPAVGEVPGDGDVPADGANGPEIIKPLPFSVPDTRMEIIEQASWVYEALLADARGGDARALFELIQDHYPVTKTYGLFMERALRLELWQVATEIGDIGMGTLDARGQKRMQRLLSRIPAEADSKDGDR